MRESSKALLVMKQSSGSYQHARAMSSECCSDNHIVSYLNKGRALQTQSPSASSALVRADPATLPVL